MRLSVYTSAHHPALSCVCTRVEGPSLTIHDLGRLAMCKHACRYTLNILSLSLTLALSLSPSGKSLATSLFSVSWYFLLVHLPVKKICRLAVSLSSSLSLFIWVSDPLLQSCSGRTSTGSRRRTLGYLSLSLSLSLSQVSASSRDTLLCLVAHCVCASVCQDNLQAGRLAQSLAYSGYPTPGHEAADDASPLAAGDASLAIHLCLKIYPRRLSVGCCSHRQSPSRSLVLSLLALSSLCWRHLSLSLSLSLPLLSHPYNDIHRPGAVTDCSSSSSFFWRLMPLASTTSALQLCTYGLRDACKI